MRKVIISTLAAAVALGATAASAETAAREAQAQLDRAFAKEAIAERQVTSARPLGNLCTVFGSELRFGITDIAPVEFGNRNFLNHRKQREAFGIGGNN